MNLMPPLLRYHIIKEGKILVEKDRTLREKIVFLTLVEALDIKDSIERYRKDRLERILDAG